MVEIYFEQLNYETLLESEAYGVNYILRTDEQNKTNVTFQIPNLLADFGGHLGLWMGMRLFPKFKYFLLKKWNFDTGLE